MMESLTRRQAETVVRRLAKQGIDAKADHRPWGSAVSFTSEGTQFRIETAAQAHRWTGYPKVEGRDE